MPLRTLPQIDRRQLLKAAVSAGLVIPGLPLLGGSPARAQFKTNPFTLGVASGEPAADGFVIWTRLAPEPLTGRGGMTVRPVEVTWEIGADSDLKQVIRSGTVDARVEVAHSVHVEVEGLEPGRDYFYRFRAGEAESPIGRVRTLPLPGADAAPLKFCGRRLPALGKRQACGDGIKAGCTEAEEPNRTMPGEAQEKWLSELLRSSKGTWQVLAQHVLFSAFDWRSFPWSRIAEPGAGNMDAWAGAVPPDSAYWACFAKSAPQPPSC